MEAVSDRLRHLVERFKVSLKDFSSLTEIPYPTLQKLVADGSTRLPEGAGMAKLARIGVNLNWLVTGEGEPIEDDFCRDYLIHQVSNLESHPAERRRVFPEGTQATRWGEDRRSELVAIDSPDIQKLDLAMAFRDAWNTAPVFAPRDQAPVAVRVVYPKLPREFLDWVMLTSGEPPRETGWRTVRPAGLDAWFATIVELAANGVSPEETLQTVRAARERVA